MARYLIPVLAQIMSGILLPPQHSARSLHDAFLHKTVVEEQRVTGNTFRLILHEDIPHVRVWMRTRGICESCFVYRESVWAVSA